MAAKAHLRNEKPLIIAVSTNDALGASAKNIGALLNCKNIFFVPFKQDMPEKKHNSCISDFSLIPKAIENALNGTQLQPILIQ
jgi:dipicolinate synthase subunit B